MISMKIFLLTAGIVSTLSVTGQEVRTKPSFRIDVGFDKSIGPNKDGQKQGVLNTNFGVGFYSWERFDNPSLRLRTSLLHPISSWFAAGIQSGVTVRFHQLNAFKWETWVAVPIQIHSELMLARFNTSSLHLNVAGGINLQKRKPSFNTTVGNGTLLTTGLTFSKKRWLINGGYEYQQDKAVFHIMADPNHSFVDEKISYRINHSLIYFSVGRTIF